MAYVRQLNGFLDDAEVAVVSTPKYFAFWYTAKSLALVAVIAAFAYHLGKGARR